MTVHTSRGKTKSIGEWIAQHNADDVIKAQVGTIRLKTPQIQVKNKNEETKQNKNLQNCCFTNECTLIYSYVKFAM